MGRFVVECPSGFVRSRARGEYGLFRRSFVLGTSIVEDASVCGFVDVLREYAPTGRYELSVAEGIQISLYTSAGRSGALECKQAHAFD